MTFFLSALLLGAQQASMADLPLVLDSMASKYHQPMVVGFGSFTYGFTGVGDSFSRVLEDRLERALTRTKNITLADRGAIKNMDPNFQEVYREHFETTGTNGLLYGTWMDSPQGVVVTLKLTELGSRRLLAAEEFVFPYSDFPPATAFIPPRLDLHATEVSQLTQTTSPPANQGGLKVDFTTSRGDSAVFREGDLFEAFLTLTQDAYVTIYQVDVNGVIQQIFPHPEWFPNSLVKKGSLVRIPPAPYEIRMVPPFGREYIKVIASTRNIRLNDISGRTLGPRDNLVEMAVGPADRRFLAEDLYWYTIVK